MRFTITALFLFLAAHALVAQNMVPNPSFEAQLKLRCRWIQSKSQFDKSLTHWTTPTETHPDIFTTKVEPSCWAHPMKQSAGVQLPRTGEAMAGISVIGKGGKRDNKTPWHEYLQVKLDEPMEKGKKYYAEMWVMHAEVATNASNNLGMHFCETAINTRNRMPLCLQPQINETKVILPKKKLAEMVPGALWQKIAGVFVAEADYRYLVIGNVYGIGQTEVKETGGGTKGAYYHIDDVLVREATDNEKATPIPARCVPQELVAVKKTTTGQHDLEEIKYAQGQVIELSNIYFETAKAELLPKSKAELVKLANMMYNFPHMEIAINGHTDNVGQKEYNMQLSRNRAQAVVDYLVKNKVDQGRTSYSGYGDTQPISTNDTDEGRANNRRVEFEITKM